MWVGRCRRGAAAIDCTRWGTEAFLNSVRNGAEPLLPLTLCFARRTTNPRVAQVHVPVQCSVLCRGLSAAGMETHVEGVKPACQRRFGTGGTSESEKPVIGSAIRVLSNSSAQTVIVGTNVSQSVQYPQSVGSSFASKSRCYGENCQGIIKKGFVHSFQPSTRLSVVQLM